jgi:hypothetical protein
LPRSCKKVNNNEYESSDEEDEEILSFEEIIATLPEKIV